MQRENSKKAISVLKYAVCFLFVFTLVATIVVSSVMVKENEAKAYTIPTDTQAMFNGLTNFSQLTADSETDYLYCVIVHAETNRYLYAHDDDSVKGERFYSHGSVDGKHNTHLDNIVWKMSRKTSSSNYDYYIFEDMNGRVLSRSNTTGSESLTDNGDRIIVKSGSGYESRWRLKGPDNTNGGLQRGAYLIRDHELKSCMNLDTGTSITVHMWSAEELTTSGWYILPIVQGFDDIARGYMTNGTKSTLSFAGNTDGLNLTAPASGTFGDGSLQLPNGQKNQNFIFEYCHNEAESYGVWKIKSELRGSYLQVEAGKNESKITFGTNRLFNTFHIVYNMGWAQDGGKVGYYLISATSSSQNEGKTTNYQYDNTAKHGFRGIDLYAGNTSKHIQLYPCNLHAGSPNRLWYFQEPVSVTVTDDFSDNKTDITEPNKSLVFNSKYIPNNYDGYHVKDEQEIIIENGQSPITTLFDPNTCTVTYNINGGTDGEMSTTEHIYNANAELQENVYKKVYSITLQKSPSQSETKQYTYTFTGWKDEDGKCYNDKETLSILENTASSNITLYAQWECEEMTLAPPTLDGYKFVGWGDKNGDPANSTFIESVNNLKNDLTVYAYWYGLTDGCTDKLADKAFSVNAALYHGDTPYNVLEVTSKKWYRVKMVADEEGNLSFKAEEVTGAADGSYTATEADEGYAIKCVTSSTFNGNKSNGETFTKTFPETLYSAYIPTDTLVDATVLTAPENKDGKYIPYLISVSIASGSKESFTLDEKVIISEINLGTLSDKDIDYKVYGVLSDGGNVLILSNSKGYDAIKGNIKRTEGHGVSREGATFESYIVEITNNDDEAISGEIKLLELPRVYELVTYGDKNFKTSYHLGFDEASGKHIYSNSQFRTSADDKIYFYKDDKIKIDIPLNPGEKLTAGSHITLNGEKIFPTHSVPVDGVVSFIYTNYYESVINRTPNVELNQIKIDKDNPMDIYVEQYTKPTLNEGKHNLNFGPLGAKIRDDGKIRFGTVWYFDDTATQNSWSRDGGMGTYVIPFINLLKQKEGETNDFLAYITEKHPDIIDSWNADISDKIVHDKELEAQMLDYLAEFIGTWNNIRQNSNTKDIPEAEKAEKIREMSFGGVEIKSEAKYYYYRTDSNGNKFMEYSIAVGNINGTYRDRQLVYIPYVSYVADWDNGFLAPNNDKYEDDIYLYQAPQKVYTYNEVYANQPNDGVVDEDGAEPEPQPETPAV